jgi:hypothetical protein
MFVPKAPHNPGSLLRPKKGAVKNRLGLERADPPSEKTGLMLSLRVQGDITSSLITPESVPCSLSVPSKIHLQFPSPPTHPQPRKNQGSGTSKYSHIPERKATYFCSPFTTGRCFRECGHPHNRKKLSFPEQHKGER